MLISQNSLFFQALEQDIVGRQSSLGAMKEKVNTFIETADRSTASSLRAKMNELSARFCEANSKHKKKLEKMEELKTNVELFECLSDKLQSFLDTKAQTLREADIPGKNVAELSLYMEVLSIFTGVKFCIPILLSRSIVNVKITSIVMVL